MDFFTVVIYYLLDITDDLFISIFTLGCIPDCTLQCIKQYKYNTLIRRS